jgi:hypothetical protein
MGCGSSAAGGGSSHNAERTFPTLDSVRDGLRERGFERSEIVGIAFDYTASNLRVRPSINAAARQHASPAPFFLLFLLESAASPQALLMRRGRGISVDMRLAAVVEGSCGTTSALVGERRGEAVGEAGAASQSDLRAPMRRQ